MAKGEVGTQFTLERIINEYFKIFILEMNFALPAVVEYVNVDNQTVNVRPTLMKKYSDGKNVQRSVIKNVQFQFPRGGDSYITLPIKVGDEGMLIFSGRDLSNWKNFGGIQPLHSNRVLDYNDAVFIPGISSYARSVQNYNPNNITIVKNGKIIEVADGKLYAPEYDIECKSVYATGKIESQTDCISAGISGKSHVHGGVSGGTSDTGVPK